MDEYITIKTLYNKGTSIRSIATMLKMSKNTVKKYLKEDKPPQYGSDPEESSDTLLSSKSKWHIYHKEIIDMYYNKRYTGSRIFNELKRKGAKGGKSGFYEYYKNITKEDIIKKVRARFETGPGKQCQFDWSEYSVEVGVKKRKIYLFQVILCYSRYKYHLASFDKSQNSIFASLESAFEFFGGIPEEILTDNAKQMVTNPNPTYFQWNAQYERFLRYYGIKPKLCKVRHAWTKGKVENPFRYLEDHFIQGSKFISIDSLNNKLALFTDEWNDQHHRGINAIPKERYLEEKEYLKSLPADKYIGNIDKWLKVSNDCLISYEGNKYSVPYQYAFGNVWGRKILGYKLTIYSQRGQIIASHEIPPTKGNVIINQDHYQGLIHSTVNSALSIKNRFMEYFNEYEIYLEKISAQKRFHWKNHILKIIKLIEIYKLEDIKSALEQGIEHNVFSYDFIVAYMREHFDIDYQEYVSKNNNIKDQEDQQITRDLQEYEEYLDGEI